MKVLSNLKPQDLNRLKKYHFLVWRHYGKNDLSFFPFNDIGLWTKFGNRNCKGVINMSFWSFEYNFALNLIGQTGH